MSFRAKLAAIENRMTTWGELPELPMDLIEEDALREGLPVDVVAAIWRQYIGFRREAYGAKLLGYVLTLGEASDEARKQRGEPLREADECELEY